MAIDEIPVLGTPLAVRGRKDLSVLLDEFTPTHLDAWQGRAVVVPSGVRGVPADAPDLLSGDGEGALLARAVVVRHGGSVSGRGLIFGARRRRLDALLTARPPSIPLLGIVIEPAGVTAVWVSGEPGEVALRLSSADWHSTVG